MSAPTVPNFVFPPEPSRASRSTIRPSRGAARVTIVAGHPRREIRLESHLEAKAAYVFLADPRIVDLCEQPPAIHYRDLQGHPRKHTFDFLLTTNTGKRILVAVKPWRRAVAKDLASTLQQIARYVPSSLADQVVLVTDKALDGDTVHNAKLIHAVRRTPDSEADAAVATVVATLNGSIAIGDLVKASGYSGRGFNACVRLIAHGTLSTVKPERLGYQTRVVRVPALAMGAVA